ncbi:MAG: hypothetical protein IID46_09735 [Planctomycetes bacterium]|nr:hypothetical protein [Planctomycetota bacterium]
MKDKRNRTRGGRKEVVPINENIRGPRLQLIDDNGENSQENQAEDEKQSHPELRLALLCRD